MEGYPRGGARTRLLNYAPWSARVRADGRELAAIFAGGLAGAIARGLLSEALPSDPGTWPWATFVANLAGAALLGYFATRLQERLPLSSYSRPLLGTGLCGALTTFSTLQLELLTMVDERAWGLAAGYVAASIAGGLACVVATTNLVRRVRPAT